MDTICPSCYCAKVYCRGCKGYHCKCSWSGRNCRTAFRKFLNEEEKALGESVSPKHKNGKYQQRTRPYGDYLYYQDREKFEADFAEWSAEVVPRRKS